MEVSHLLGAEDYVFWGGREGYQSLLNTNLKLEQDHMATFLRKRKRRERKTEGRTERTTRRRIERQSKIVRQRDERDERDERECGHGDRATDVERD